MRALLVFTFLALAACARPLNPVAPDSPASITLRLTPPAILAGGATWITCSIPESLGPGLVRYGIPGLRMSGPESVQHIQNRLLVEFIPCGTWLAECSAVFHTGVRQHRTAPLIAAGDCT